VKKSKVQVYLKNYDTQILIVTKKGCHFRTCNGELELTFYYTRGKLAKFITDTEYWCNYKKSTSEESAIILSWKNLENL